MPHSPDHDAELPSCSICQQPYNSSGAQRECPVKLSCGHEFGLLCINQWLNVPGRPHGCPLCREPVFETRRNDEIEAQANHYTSAPAEFVPDYRHRSYTYRGANLTYVMNVSNVRRDFGPHNFLGSFLTPGSIDGLVQEAESGTQPLDINAPEELNEEDFMSDSDSINEEGWFDSDFDYTPTFTNQNSDRMRLNNMPPDHGNPQRATELPWIRRQINQAWKNIEARECARGNYLPYSQLMNRAHHDVFSTFTNALENRYTDQHRLRLRLLDEIRRKDARRHRKRIQSHVEDVIKTAIIQSPKLNLSFTMRMYINSRIVNQSFVRCLRSSVDDRMSRLATALPGLWRALCACYDNRNLRPWLMMDVFDLAALFQADLELETLNPGQARAQAHEARVEATEEEQNHAMARLANNPAGSQEYANSLNEAIESFDRLRGIMAAHNLIDSPVPDATRVE